MNERPMAKDERDRDLKHPIGASVGGVAGAAAAGAAVGTVAGPIGTAVGALAGALVGGATGSKIADMIVPADEEAYWRDNFNDRAYGVGREFDEFAPAYRFGVDRYPQYHGRQWDEVEPELERDWATARGDSTMAWSDARHATRDSWQRLSDRLERLTPGDSDRDGK